MSTSEKCMKCDGTPLKTGECNPMCCTTVFPNQIVTLNPDIVVIGYSSYFAPKLLEPNKVKCEKK